MTQPQDRMDLSSLDADELSAIKEFARLAWKAIPARLKKTMRDFGTSSWNKVTWSQKAQIYSEGLYRRVHSTRLLGKAKEIRVADIYTDVYLYKSPLRSSRRHILSHDAEALQQKRKDDESLRQPAHEVLNANKRLYLLGKPGAGKTTLLRHLSIQAILGEKKWTPIYVPLKDVVRTARKEEDVDLLKFIEAQFEPCNLPDVRVFVNELLGSGKAVLMLDGLDEVTEAKGIRKKLIFDTEILADRIPNLRMILTCRVGSEEYSFDSFATAQIADFSPDQQLRFVKRWYSHDPTMLTAFLDHWKAPDNRGLRDLASTPLLLALLCISFDETREFPMRRSDLYEEAAWALLQDWSVKRGIERDNPFPTLTASRKAQMLSVLAYSLFRPNRIIFSPRTAYPIIDGYIATLPKREQPKHYEASAIVNHIESAHGLLIHETSDYLSFSHLTIHEYFTAKFLIDTTNENELRNALGLDNLRSRRWREVFLLAAGLITSANYMLARIRLELSRVVSVDPQLGRALTRLTTSADPAIVWGDWAADPRKLTGSKAEIESGMGLKHFKDSLQSRLRSILAAARSGIASKTALARVDCLCKNLSGEHLLPAFVYFGEGGRNRLDRLLAVLEVEEVYTQVLAIGTVSDRTASEASLFVYQG